MTQVNHMMANPADGRMWLADKNTYLWKERLPTADSVPDAVDRNYTITVTDNTGNNITVSAGSGWTPAEGDLVTRSGYAGIVTVVVSQTVVTLDNAYPGGSTATVYDSFQCDVKWRPNVGRDSTARKHFVEGAFSFDNFVGIPASTYKINSDFSLESANPTSIAESHARDTTQDSFPITDVVGATRRFLVPAAHARTSRIGVEIEIKAGGAPFQLTGMSIVFWPMAQRGVRR